MRQWLGSWSDGVVADVWFTLLYVIRSLQSHVPQLDVAHIADPPNHARLERERKTQTQSPRWLQVEAQCHCLLHLSHRRLALIPVAQVARIEAPLLLRLLDCQEVLHLRQSRRR